MPNASHPRRAYQPTYTKTEHSSGQPLHPDADDRVGSSLPSTRSQASTQQIQTNLDEVRRIPTSAAPTSCMSTKASVLLAMALTLCLAAAVVPATIISLSQITTTTERSSSTSTVFFNTTSTTATTATTTTPAPTTTSTSATTTTTTATTSTATTVTTATTATTATTTTTSTTATTTTTTTTTTSTTTTTTVTTTTTTTTTSSTTTSTTSTTTSTTTTTTSTTTTTTSTTTSTTSTTTSTTSTTTSTTTTSTSTTTSTTTTTTSTTTTTTSTTTSTTTTTTSTTTTTTTTTNLCLSNTLRWNTTGITILNGSQYSSMSGLYIDANGTLFAADEYNNYVAWKLPRNALNATLVAGIYRVRSNSTTGLDFPQDVYSDSRQNLYVTDYYGARVQKYINGSLVGVTIAGTSGVPGTALNQFAGLRYFWFDPTDTYMYVTDCDNHRIMRYLTNATGGSNGVLVAGGNGSGNTATTLNYPWGIHSIPSITNDLYISNYWGGSVIRWTPGASSGTFVAGTPGVAGSNSTQLNGPMGLKIDSNLNMYVVDCLNNRVQMFCYNSLVGVTIAGTGVAGNGPTQLNAPRGIAFDSTMNMYIGDPVNQRIQKFLKL